MSFAKTNTRTSSRLERIAKNGGVVRSLGTGIIWNRLISRMPLFDELTSTPTTQSLSQGGVPRMMKKKGRFDREGAKEDERDANDDEEVGEPGAPEGVHLALLLRRAVRVYAAVDVDLAALAWLTSFSRIIS